MVVERRRKYSKYSKAYYRAKKEGKDKEACKKAGQEASKKMAATLENQS